MEEKTGDSSFKNLFIREFQGHKKKVSLTDPFLCFSFTFLSDRGVSRLFFFFIFYMFKVHSVAWNCSGTKLASGSVDHTARVWNIDPQGHVSQAFLQIQPSNSLFSESFHFPNHSVGSNMLGTNGIMISHYIL